jgi:dienelactone hydrolase
MAAAASLLCFSAQARPEDFRNFVLWYPPQGTQIVPFVVLLEGTGGTGPTNRNPWVDWFNSRGVGVAQVRSAASRGKSNWSGTSCGLQYRGDARDVVDLARMEQPRFDQSRFALMGFSRGGTEVLNSAASFRGASAQPSAVFALYPGCEGWCQTDYSKDGSTTVQILYGDRDEWGKYRDSYGQCRRLAGGRISFHSIPGAHHGFDNRFSGTFNTASQVFRYEPSAEGTEMAEGWFGRCWRRSGACDNAYAKMSDPSCEWNRGDRYG